MTDTVQGLHGAKKPEKLPPYTYLDGMQSRLLVPDLKYSPNSADESRFSFHLKTFDVEMAPSFIALSYTWGSPTGQWKAGESLKQLDILVNGVRLRVGQFLYEALCCIWKRCLLKPLQKHYFWIDAICIDQNDTDEKSFQVRIMDSIYGEARKVWVWLGTSEGLPVDHALELVQKLARANRDMNRHLLNGELSGLGLDWKTATLDGRILKKNNIPSSFRDKSWRALISLLERQWWSRMWIIQEISLAGSADLLIGDRMLPWEDVARCSTFLSMGLDTVLSEQLERQCEANGRVSLVGAGLVTLNVIQFLITTPMSANASMTSYLTGRRELISKAAVLCVLLHLSRGWKATDPRDQVYALLGLVSRISAEQPTPGGMANFIVPDYDKSEELEGDKKSQYQVFRHVAERIIEGTRWLGYLTLVGGVGEKSVDGIPSWVPDLSILPQSRVGLGSGFERRLTLLKDTGRRASSTETLKVVGSVLYCCGMKLGGVSAVSEPLDDFCEGRSTFEVGAGLVLELRKTYALTKDSREDVVWKTLVASKSTKNSLKQSFGQFWLRKLVAVGLQRGVAIDDFLKGIPAILKLGSSTRDTPFPTEQNIRQLLASDKSDPSTKELHGTLAIDSAEFETMFRTLCCSRRMFLTDRNHLGIGHVSMQKGDEVWFLARAPTPFVLRRVDKRPGVFTLVGHAYLHGFFELLEKIEIEYWPIEII